MRVYDVKEMVIQNPRCEVSQKVEDNVAPQRSLLVVENVLVTHTELVEVKCITMCHEVKHKLWVHSKECTQQT